MTKLRLIFRLKIHNGKLDALKRVAARILTIVQQKGPGTLEYEWFMSADQSECVVLETFASSEALLEHAELVAAEAAELFAVCDLVDIWLCGKPSREVMEKTAAFAPKVYEFLQGRQR